MVFKKKKLELGGLNYFEEIFWSSVFFCGEIWQLGEFVFKKWEKKGEICDFMDFHAILKNKNN